MLEFLQPLVDLIAKAVPAIARHRERDGAAKLGAELFLLYVQCNEALVLGAKIVDSLEYYASMPPHSRRAYQSYHGLADLVQEQMRNLTGIGNRLDRFQFEFHVLSGRAALDLEFLIDWKSSALTLLANTIAHRQLPLRSAGVLIDDDGVLQLADRPSRSQLEQLRYQLGDELAASTLPLDRSWGPEASELLQRYLDVRRPREQLDRIRDALETVREALVANFTLGDVLLRAGDPRGNRRWRPS